jgi:hypothetical protein
LCSKPGVDSESGVLLFECIVYIALWAAITALAFSAYYRVLDNSTHLRRSADDIARALRAGEIWRKDIRQASAPIRIVREDGNAEEAWHIPQSSGEVVYFFTGQDLLRRVGEDSSWVPLLRGIRNSSLARDVGREITSWRWEVELMTGKKKPLTLPLFTFQAVPTFQEKR